MSATLYACCCVHPPTAGGNSSMHMHANREPQIARTLGSKCENKVSMNPVVHYVTNDAII